MRVGDHLLNLTLLIASLAGALVAGEVIVRLLQGAGVLSSRDSVVFPEVRFVGKQRVSANKTLIFELDPSDPLINEDGFRDRDYPIAKGEAFRIMALGDSVTFGRGVALEDTYAKVLERLLNDESSEGHSYEVMNVAVGGYNSRQELELYRTVGRKYLPDLLIVGFVLNDCHPASLLMGHWAKLRKERESAAGSSGEESTEGSPQSAQRELFARSRLFEMLRTLASERSAERPGAPQWISKQCAIPENWAIVQRAFRDLAAISASDGIPVLIAIFPMLYDFERYPFTVLHRRVRAEAHSHGLRVVDLLPAFATRDAEAFQAAPGDLAHPNEAGHRVAAERIREFLVESEIVPR